MAKITAEICENRKIHDIITAPIVKSEHGSEVPIVNIQHCFVIPFYTLDRKINTTNSH